MSSPSIGTYRISDSEAPPRRPSLLLDIVLFFSRYLPRGYGYLPRRIGPKILRERTYSTRTKRGFRMVWHASNIEMVPHLHRFRGWDEEVAAALTARAPSARIIYDIGANSGYMALAAASAAPAARVIAFEPIPALAASITSAATANGFANIEVYNVALSSQHGSIDLYVPTRTVHASFVAREHAAKLEVPTFAIDDLVKSGELPPPDLIKIDVEGAEMMVLTGAQRVLREHRPILIYECDENAARFGHSPKALMEMLAGLGYSRFTFIGKDGSPDRVATGEDAPLGDYIAS